MMSTADAGSAPCNRSAKCDNSKSVQGCELPKLGIFKSDSDSGLGLSDSSDSMCDVKDSFKEAIMNLKALNGSGDSEISDLKETQLSKPGDLVKKVSQNGNDSLNDGDTANGDNMSASDSPLANDKTNDDQNGVSNKVVEEKSPERNTETASKDSSPEPDEQTKDVTEDTLSEPVHCEDQTEKMEEQCENHPEQPSQEASQEQCKEVSQEAISPESVDPCAPSVQKDKIEIVDSDNEDIKETAPAADDDDDVMIVSGKDERSNDSESSDHPLTIGDKVKKSVRDIMSKLKQGISPELNKILVKPKQEETMEADTSETISDSKPTENKPLLESPRKGNLFENLTVIGARTESSIKMEGKSADVKDEQNDSKTSNESDVELIEDGDFDKKDDDIIIFDDKSSSGQKSATQDIKNVKLEEDAKLDILATSSDVNDKKKQKDLKKEVKDEVKTKSKPEPTSVEKPMEIDDDDDEDESDKVKPFIKITPPSDKSEESSEPCAVARNERKRSQDSQSGDGGPPKRSRLDMVIGKLGSQIGISPEMIKCESSDEDSRQCSDTSEKSEDNLSSVSDEEDDKTSQSSTKTIRLSGKELEAIVRSKVSAYLKAHRDSKMETLRSRVEELQTANETWKSQAKELQKQVLDLTVLQQRLEKRKAATAALRQITTRSVGIQADDTKTNFATGQAVKVAKTPPKAAAPATSMTITAPLLSSTVTTGTTSSTSVQGVVMTTSQVLPTSAVSRNSVTQLLSATAVSRNTPTQPTIIGSPAMAMTQGVRPQLAQHLSSTALTSTLGNSLTTVRSLLDTSKTIDSISKLQTVPGQALSGSNVIVVSSPTLSTQAPKIIDLTSDDDSAKGPAASQQSRTVQVVPGNTVSAIRPGLVQQQPAVIRGMNPLTLQQSLPTGTSILLSSPAGLMSPGTTNLTRPGGTFQIVTVASGSNLRPGTLLTVVPAGSSVTTPQTQIRSAIPSVLPVAKPAVSAVAPTMPQLKPVTPLSTVTVSAPARPVSSSPVVTTRPPPPLQTAPAVSIVSTDNTGTVSTPPPQKHPAPLPPRPGNQPTKGLKGLMPPKPGLKISRVSQGIVLSWNMTVNDSHADIESYQLFAYQESSAAPSTSLWKKVGNVKALPLPMACTLTQFQEGNKYHFAVRAVDTHNRIGDFSDPSTIHLTPK